VANDHGDRLSPPIMKFNIKVAPLGRGRLLARTAGFPVLLGQSIRGKA
jgi:hypothetical protein